MSFKDYVKKLSPSAGAEKGCRDPACLKEEHYFRVTAGALPVSVLQRETQEKGCHRARWSSGQGVQPLWWPGCSGRDPLILGHPESRWWDPGWGLGPALFCAEPCGRQLGAMPG